MPSTKQVSLSALFFFSFKFHILKGKQAFVMVLFVLIITHLQIPIIYMDDSDESELMTENDKTTNENTERNRNIPPAFDLMSDDEQEQITLHGVASDRLEPPVVAVKGTVV